MVRAGVLCASVLLALALGSAASAQQRSQPLVPGPHWFAYVSGRWDLTFEHPSLAEPSICTAILTSPDAVAVTGTIDCPGIGSDVVSGMVTPITWNLTVGGDLITVEADAGTDIMSGSWTATSLEGPGTMSGERKLMPAGDADCDGDVTAVDAQLVLQLHAGLIAGTDDVGGLSLGLPCALEADVAGGRLLDSVDALVILQMTAALVDVT